MAHGTLTREQMDWGTALAQAEADFDQSRFPKDWTDGTIERTLR